MKTKGISIVGLDPGETTGFCWLCISHNEIKQVDGNLFRAASLAADNQRLILEQIKGSDEYDSAMDIQSWIQIAIGETKRKTHSALETVTEIVIEDFILRERSKKRDLLTPVRIIAMTGILLYNKQMIDRVTYQQPSAAKSVITNARLSVAGLYVPARPHAMDALRHCLLRLRVLQNAGEL